MLSILLHGYRSLDLHFVQDSYTLNRNFFQALDLSNAPSTVLPKSGSFAKQHNLRDLLKVKTPGVLARFQAGHTPVQFDPKNQDHVIAWQEFAIYKRAMPLMFILEGTFSNIPEMIRYKMSVDQPQTNRVHITTLQESPRKSMGVKNSTNLYKGEPHDC